MKTETFKIRLSWAERKAFRDAAEANGMTLAAWMRERLRSAARRELEAAGLQIAFVEKGAIDDGEEIPL